MMLFSGKLKVIVCVTKSSYYTNHNYIVVILDASRSKWYVILWPTLVI